jgi:hypothetical protein
VTEEAHAKELILGPCGTSLKAELLRGGQSVTVTLWRGGAEAKAKGEAAEKADAESEVKAAVEAKAAAEANQKPEVHVKAVAASSGKGGAARGGGPAAFKGQCSLFREHPSIIFNMPEFRFRTRNDDCHRPLRL